MHGHVPLVVSNTSYSRAAPGQKSQLMHANRASQLIDKNDGSSVSIIGISSGAAAAHRNVKQ